MKALFAVRIGAEDWQEELITEREEHIEDAKTWAINQGFDRFRVMDFKDGDKPDFKKILNINT